MSQELNQLLPFGQINEYKARLIAFLVLTSVVVYWFTESSLIPLLLLLDFGLRSLDLGKFSPFAQLAEQLVKTFNLGIKAVFYPPKRFAARIGLAFSIIITALHFLGINILIVSGILGFFAALESLAGICAGCYMYNWFLPVWQKLNLD